MLRRQRFHARRPQADDGLDADDICKSHLSDAIVRACKDAWNFLVNDPERIVSIGTRHWASVDG
jgi:hypothetical protein